MRPDYVGWLRKQDYDEGTVTAQVYRAVRVEEHYGDLVGHFHVDQLESVIQTLLYSTADERQGRANPSKIPFNGSVRSNLASYRNAIARYRRFLMEPEGQTRVARPERSSKLVRLAVARVQDPKTLLDFELDGFAALEGLLKSSRYGGLVQAVAALALFSHPETVRQTGGRGIFPMVRGQSRVGQFGVQADREIMFDDNKSPTDAFLWANGLSRRGRDTQFNHIYASSLDPESYTALPNICMTPAFIAKLTDTSPAVRAHLKYRVFELFGWAPTGAATPPRPAGYDEIEWADTLPPVDNLKARMIGAMATKPKDRTVAAARRLGWLFGDPSA